MAVAAAGAKAGWVVLRENGRGEVAEAGEVSVAALAEVEAPMDSVTAMEAAMAEAVGAMSEGRA